MKMHKLLPTDANMDTIFTLASPFIMYLAAEEFHASGVLSVVSGGLFLSVRRHHFLSGTSRLHSINVWQSFSFLLNGMVFMLIGLDLPLIVSGLGDTSIFQATMYGVIITVVLIIIRMFASYGAVVFTLIMRNFINVADAESPGWKVPIVLGWTGMRGVVSLAAALSIPVTLADGSPFPHRNLILFITFVVILLTLVLQGLTLPLLLKKVKLKDKDFIKSEKEIDYEIRSELAKIAVEKIKKEYPEKLEQFPALKEQFQSWENRINSSEIIINYPEYQQIFADILEHQRMWLINKNREELLLDEEIVRKHLRLIDLQEERLSLGK